ncbi:MAG: mono/diheme cytochrome c family protein [Myxococcota bacterium]|jgi:mono/diheme cytochrome c family protein
MFLTLLACFPPDGTETGIPSTPAACSYDTGETESALSLDGDPDCGAEIFVADCTGCHGASGEGTEQGPGLSEHVQGHSDAALLAVLVLGTDEMPAAELTQQGYADVLAHLRATFGEYTDTTH